MPARAGAVRPAAREQLATDAGALQLLRDTEEREAPDALADQREPAAGYAPVVLGHPAAAGIGLPRGQQRPLHRRVLGR